MGGGLVLNGIDHLVVVDGKSPNGMAHEQLDVTFLKTSGVALLTKENFAIHGGTRIRDLEVLTANRLDDGHTVRLTLDRAGDFSTYTLSLRKDPRHPEAIANMDPQLSSLSFSFKVDCPSPFDGAKVEQPAPARPSGPPTDYLSRDWAGFRQLMLDRMAGTLPGWTERNPADLGVTLVEVLADAADRVSWFQDAVGTEAFFEKARFRQSLVRHARLLGYRASEGQNARTAVAITASTDKYGSPDILPRGTRFLTRPESTSGRHNPVLPRNAELIERMVRHGSIVFESLEPLRSLRTARNRIELHDWGDEHCCLEAGATSAYLRGSPKDLELFKGDLLILEETVPFGGSHGDSPEPSHRQLVRLCEEPRAADDPVFNQPLTEIHWFSEDALRFPLPIGRVGGQAMSVARGNVILVDEGRTLDYRTTGAAAYEDEIALGLDTTTGLLPDDGPGRTHRLRLNAQAVVRAVPFTPREAREQPALAALAPRGVPVAQVSLHGDGDTWTIVPDLLASERYAPHFVVEPGTAPGAAYVRFGDGVLGRLPNDGAVFRARIRHGGGPRGNIGAGSIAHVVTGDGSGIHTIEHPIPATGGCDLESRTAIQVAAPQAFRVPKRAVTASDYATAVTLHPAVTHAYARRRWTGSWSTITVAIDRVGGGDIDDALEADLRAFLEDYRLAGHDLEFISPRFVPLNLCFHVCVKADAEIPEVQQDLLDLFSNRDLPNGSRGLFHPDDLAFGQDVALSPLIARAMQVEGVAWIGMTTEADQSLGYFSRMDQPGINYAADGILPIASSEIARLDNDPSRPEHGQVKFLMNGGR